MIHNLIYEQMKKQNCLWERRFRRTVFNNNQAESIDFPEIRGQVLNHFGTTHRNPPLATFSMKEYETDRNIIKKGLNHRKHFPIGTHANDLAGPEKQQLSKMFRRKPHHHLKPQKRQTDENRPNEHDGVHTRPSTPAFQKVSTVPFQSAGRAFTFPPFVW